MQKLKSRKFWAAVAGFVTPLAALLGGTDELAGKITAVIMSGSTLICYILAEGYADGKHADSEADGDDVKMFFVV